ncbi:hypothetical protein D6825_00275 [Candidatus Woesearchaeota archaeon]|nr:MAG: hypothetical protein D6825_00275 [Candidatus Woesearchaeota archaeon]
MQAIPKPETRVEIVEEVAELRLKEFIDVVFTLCVTALGAVGLKNTPDSSSEIVLFGQESYDITGLPWFDDTMLRNQIVTAITVAVFIVVSITFGYFKARYGR